MSRLVTLANRIGVGPCEEPVDDSPSLAAKGRASLPAVAEWAVALTVALVMMWPVTFDLASRMVGSGDGLYYLWQGWRLGNLLLSADVLDMRIPDVVHPYGVDLRLSDGLLPSVIGGVWNWVAQPILAYNLAILTATLLNIWASRKLAMLFSRRRVVWLLTGLAFATAPSIAYRIYGHYTLYFAFTAPLIVAEAVRVARTREIRPFRLSLLLFGAYLCSITYLLFGGVAFAVIAVPSLLSTRPRAKGVVRLMATGALVLVLLLPFIVPRLQLDGREAAAGSLPVGVVASDTYSANLLSLVTQPFLATFELPWSPAFRAHMTDNAIEGAFVGYALLLALPGVVLLRHRLRWALVAAATTIWLFCLGTILKLGGRVIYDADGRGFDLLPFSWLLEVPGLGSMRTPARAAFTLAAILAAALAISLDGVLDRLRRRWQRGLVTAAVAALLLPNVSIPVTSDSFGTTPAMEAALRQIAGRARPGEATEYVPADCRDDASQMVRLQVFHRTPVVGCQAGTSSIPWFSSLHLYASSRGLAALRCMPGSIGRRPTRFTTPVELTRADLDELNRALGVRFYIVDHTMLAAPECAWLRDHLGPLGDYERVGGDRRWDVIDVRNRP